MVFRGGPLDILLSRPEIEEITGQKPLEFAKAFIERFNEIRDCKIIKSKAFSKVLEYFNEAKRCYITGNYRASLIIALSALECCLRIDYRRNTGEKWPGKLFQIIKYYFGEGKLPSTYTELGQISNKIRNDITHPCHKEEYDYTYTTVWHNLEVIKELINYVIKNYAEKYSY